MRQSVFIFFFVIILYPFSQSYAQSLAEPRPYMYDMNLGLLTPPDGCSKIEIRRFMPGSKFPSGWDLLVETMDYDDEGRLIAWRTFHQVNGNMIKELIYTYDKYGNLTEERTSLSAQNKTEVKRFENTYDASGTLQKVKVLISGKVYANIEYDEKRNHLYKMDPAGSGKSDVYGFDNLNRMVYHENPQSGEKLAYIYDDKGNLSEVRIEKDGLNGFKKYENKYDGNGKIQSQMDDSPGMGRVQTFGYDEKRTTDYVIKYEGGTMPLEYRDYWPDGTLKYVVICDGSGTAKEMLHLFYQY